MDQESMPSTTIRPLTPALQQVAESELNEVPSRIADDIEALRKWIRLQPHLRARIEDQFLISFLRGSKFSLEKTKKKIDRYYTLKVTIPEIYNERRCIEDPTVMEIVRMGIILQIPLPCTETGPSVTIVRACSYDTTKYKFADIVRVGSMFGDIMMLEDDNASISGYMEIMDMENVTATNLFQLQPELLKKLSAFATEAMPTRQQGTHFINVPPPFAKGFSTLHSLFPAKALSRITVNSDPEALYNYVSREYLPIEYGGENGCMQDIITKMEAKILKYGDYFKAEKNYGTDEKLREGKAYHNDNCFGVEGSFRKIDID